MDNTDSRREEERARTLRRTQRDGGQRGPDLTGCLSTPPLLHAPLLSVSHHRQQQPRTNSIHTHSLLTNSRRKLSHPYKLTQTYTLFVSSFRFCPIHSRVSFKINQGTKFMVRSASMLIARASRASKAAARASQASLTRTAASLTGSTLASGLTHSGFHSACLNWAMVPSLSTDNKTDSTTADPLFYYSQALSSPLPAKFKELHASSVQHYPATADKTVSDLQGQFLRLLMRMTRPRRVLELGCFMGYSAMAMADGMTPDGVLYTCEKDTQAAHLARELFDKEGYTGKRGKATIELLEGDALASLEMLAKNELQFDAIFIGM